MPGSGVEEVSDRMLLGQNGPPSYVAPQARERSIARADEQHSHLPPRILENKMAFWVSWSGSGFIKEVALSTSYSRVTHEDSDPRLPSG